MNVLYKYVGKGDFIPGIPARDIAESEVHLYDVNALDGSGLWEKVKPSKAKVEVPDTKTKMDVPDVGTEDKMKKPSRTNKQSDDSEAKG
jgi:hypothetical protein